MSIRIRVYPQGYFGRTFGGFGAFGGYGGYGGYGMSTQMQLDNERKTNRLRLQYERALWAEKLKQVQLQSALQYGAGATAAAYSSYGISPYAIRPMSYGFGVNPALFSGLGMGLGDIDTTAVSMLGIDAL